MDKWFRTSYVESARKSWSGKTGQGVKLSYMIKGGLCSGDSSLGKESVASMEAGFSVKLEVQKNDHVTGVKELHAKIGQLSVGRHRIRRLMRAMSLRAIYYEPSTNQPPPEHKVYPYLLRNLVVKRPNQVWCADITYIPIKRGFLYLMAIMDCYSRKILSWRLSNTMGTHFCIESLEEALDLYGRPDIFNRDQGLKFTSFDFISVLKENKIKISMDRKGRSLGNVFIEGLCRSLKYECVYLNAFENGSSTQTN